MKVIVFFALFAFAYGEYPAAVPEIVEPSDSYGPPPENPASVYSAPSDSYSAPAPAPAAPAETYGAPTKAAVVKAAPITPTIAAPIAAPEILTPEPIITETVAAAPAQSASFNFLSELSLPSIAHEPISVPLAPELHTTLVPPTFSLPQYQYLPQTFSAAPVRIAVQAAAAPPVVLPPIQAPLPLPPLAIPPLPIQPLPVQPLPVQPLPVQPLPVQPLPLETKTTTTPVTQFTQFTTLPRSYYSHQYLVSAPTPVSYASTPLTYAPSYSNFFSASSFPTSFYTAPRIATQISNFLPELTTFKSAPAATVKAAPAIPRIPSTSYGTPAFEKKK